MEFLESSREKEKEKHPGSKMTTKELARSMGLVRKPLLDFSKPTSKPRTCHQFVYLIVIDFEATCWREKKLNYAPEIIEFPAVLLNTSTGLFESEFHMYAQPSEQPRLSGFCTELTGITQAQVDDGVPIGTCLLMFSRWLQKLKQEQGIQFPCEYAQSKENLGLVKWCTFVTWSDWDLGVCLKNESHRKQLRFPQPLRSWIDLRATYKSFYSRKPKGLAGALQDVGIKFSGRQHSGLDDARNTAKLAWRMIQDGCVLKETKALDGPLKSLWDITRTGQTMNSTRNEQHTNRDNENIAKNVPKSTGGEDSERRGCQEQVVRAGSFCQTVAEPTTSTGLKSDVVVTEECDKRLGNTGRDPSDQSGGVGTFTQILKRKMVPTNESNCSLISPKVSVLESSGSLLKATSTSTASLVMPVTCLSMVRNTVGTGRVCQSLISERAIPVLRWKTGLVRQTVKKLKNIVRGTNVSEHVASDWRDGLGITSNVPSRTPNTCKSEQPRSNMSHQVDNKIYGDGNQAARCTSAMKLLPTTASRKLNTGASASFSGPKKDPVNREQASSTPKLDISCPFRAKFETTKSTSNSGKLGATQTWSKDTKLRTPLSGLLNVRPGGLMARFSGGKATPPFCHCGRRSRRRAAVNPGPNQGRVFYTCPHNYRQLSYGTASMSHGHKKTGCNFFHWES